MYPTYPPMMTGQRQRLPTYRPQTGNGLGQLGTGYAPPEGPPMMQPPQQGYLPREPGAYQQPYNTGIVPPGFNQRPPMYGVNDGNRMPGYNGQPFTQPNKGANWNFGDANHMPPMHRPFWYRMNGPGGR
jgi:hypothetical protein